MRESKVAIYARVSTGKQDTEVQLTALRQLAQNAGWRIFEEFIDQASGKDTNRPAFKELMTAAKRRRFDILLVWKLDRLGRSLKDLVNTLDELGHLGIDFVSYSDSLDTSTPAGKLLFQVMGAIAEFERELIRERVRAGIQNARRNGKKLGRPKIDLDINDIWQQIATGKSKRTIAKAYGVDEKTIRNMVRQ